MSHVSGGTVLNFLSARTSITRPPNALAVGDCAPDAALTDTNGRETTLSSYWARRPVVVVFLRHFGCIFCREQVALLRRDYSKFSALNAEIVCVALGAYKTGKAFQIFLDLPFPILVSGEDSSVFRAYGLGRGSLLQLFGPMAVLGGIRNILRGHTQGLVESDGFQMPGTFIIDLQGMVRYAHRNRDVTDHASHAELFSVLSSLQDDGVPSDHPINEGNLP